MLLRYLKLKESIMPLTALERHIFTNKSYHEENNISAFLTYLYLLAYEDLALEYLKNGGSYETLIEALRGKKAKDAAENTHYKTALYNGSILLVFTLILAASAVSVGSLMGLMDGRFGAYSYFAQTFFYICATWAQWMIFRKNVPKVLASFFYIGKGREWHYFKNRELTIEDEKLNVKADNESFGPKNTAILMLFSVLTGILALSLGMIVIEKGPIFESMHLPSLFVDSVFMGNFGALMTVLCVVYIFCHFALYISAVIALLKNKDGIKSIFEKIRKGTPLLVVLCALSIFGLINTMTAQSKSTFMFFDMSPFDEGFTVVATDQLIAFVALFSILAASGRFLFNLKTMENLYQVGRVALPTLPGILVQDVKANLPNYIVGSLITIGLVLSFTLIGVYGNPTQTIWETGTFVPAELGTTLGLTVISALCAWGLFKVTMGIRNQGARQQQELDAQCRPEYLKPTTELRSGQMIGAMLVNSATSGAVSVTGMEVMIALYGDAINGQQFDREWHVALLVLAGIAGAFVALASSMNAVEFNHDNKEIVDEQQTKEKPRA